MRRRNGGNGSDPVVRVMPGGQRPRHQPAHADANQNNLGCRYRFEQQLHMFGPILNPGDHRHLRHMCIDARLGNNGTETTEILESTPGETGFRATEKPMQENETDVLGIHTQT